MFANTKRETKNFHSSFIFLFIRVSPSWESIPNRMENLAVGNWLSKLNRRAIFSLGERSLLTASNFDQILSTLIAASQRGFTLDNKQRCSSIGGREGGLPRDDDGVNEFKVELPISNERQDGINSWTSGGSWFSMKKGLKLDSAAAGRREGCALEIIEK